MVCGRTCPLRCRSLTPPWVSSRVLRASARSGRCIPMASVDLAETRPAEHLVQRTRAPQCEETHLASCANRPLRAAAEPRMQCLVPAEACKHLVAPLRTPEKPFRAHAARPTPLIPGTVRIGGISWSPALRLWSAFHCILGSLLTRTAWESRFRDAKIFDAFHSHRIIAMSHCKLLAMQLHQRRK